MTEKSNYKKMLSGEYYHPDEELAEMAYKCSKDLMYINSHPARDPERDAFLKDFFAAIGERVTIKGNFNCDYGRHISIGDGCIINCNVTILDTACVDIWKGCIYCTGSCDYNSNTSAGCRKTGIQKFYWKFNCY